MGRKSLAPERREQILDGLERCIWQYGLAGSSLERIAEEAGVQRTIIRHYFGGKDAVVEAVIERIVDRYQLELQTILEPQPPGRRRTALLDYLFGGAFTDHEREERILNELFARADQDERTRKLLWQTYGLFESICRREVGTMYPDAPTTLRNAVAYSIMCLAFGNATFLSIGFDAAHIAAARTGANTLLAALTTPGTVPATGAPT